MREPQATHTRRIVMLGIVAVAFGALMMAFAAYNFVFHTDENRLAATACKGAVGAKPSPDLARLCLATEMLSPGGKSEVGDAWEKEREKQRHLLACVADGGDGCGVRSISVNGILSALPNRYSVSVKIEDGITRECSIRGAPGW